MATDYELYTHHLLDAFKIWQGGLGIWGGIAGGVFAGWLYIRRHSLDFLAILDCAAPALPLAQAIGRWGNYFNQELFGRPTTLPWGLKIDPANRLLGVRPLRHVPTHVSLRKPVGPLAVVGLVLLVEKRVGLRKGYLFWVYVSLYTFGRFFTEYLRIDFAHKILGLRINDWMSVIIFVVATGLVLRKGLTGRPPATEEAGGGDDDDDDRGVDDPELERSLVAAAAARPGATATIGGETIDEGAIGSLPDEEAGLTEAEGDLPCPGGRRSPPVRAEAEPPAPLRCRSPRRRARAPAPGRVPPRLAADPPTAATTPTRPRSRRRDAGCPAARIPAAEPRPARTQPPVTPPKVHRSRRPGERQLNRRLWAIWAKIAGGPATLVSCTSSTSTVRPALEEDQILHRHLLLLFTTLESELERQARPAAGCRSRPHSAPPC